MNARADPPEAGLPVQQRPQAYWAALTPIQRKAASNEMHQYILTKSCEYQASPEFYDTRRQIAGEALCRFLDKLVSLGKPEREAALSVCAAALDEFGAGMPEWNGFTATARRDAAWWADCANPVELEAFAGAALRAIERQEFGLAARKRLLMMLWKSLNADDQANFIARVSPSAANRGLA